MANMCLNASLSMHYRWYMEEIGIIAARRHEGDENTAGVPFPYYNVQQWPIKRVHCIGWFVMVLIMDVLVASLRKCLIR